MSDDSTDNPSNRQPGAPPDLLGELTRIMRQAHTGIEPTVQAVLGLGLRRLGLSIGILARIEGERYTVMQVVQPEGVGLAVGQVFALGSTYCRDVVARGRTVCEHHVSNSAMRGHPAFKAFGLEAYLGVPVMVGDRAWGTLNFSGPAPRDRAFSAEDVKAIELVTAWLGTELGRAELQAESEGARDQAMALAERFEAFMVNSPALKWAVDEQGRYVFMNRTYERVMNVDAASSIGLTPEQVLAPEIFASLRNVIEQSNHEVQSTPDRLIFQVRLPVGDRVLPLYCTKFVFHDPDGRPLIGGSAIDMSELSRVEAELRESEERFRQAFDNAPIGLALVGLDGRWLQVNRALSEIVGYTPDELMQLDFQTITHPDDLDGDLALVKQLLDDQIKFYQLDKRYFHKSGRLVWIRLSGSLVRSPRNHQPLYFIAQIEDVTQPREYEQALAQRNDDLKTLLYVISHDLREPLRAIRNFSSIVQEDYAQALDARGHDMLDRVVRGAMRLDQLLADVLTLSRAQRADLAVLKVDTGQIVAEVLEELQGSIEDKGAVIEVEAGLPQITIDPLWLKRAVYNLVSNALKFTQPGEPPRIRISAPRPVGAAGRGSAPQGLIVADRGPGIAPALREKIFGLFQRGVGRDVPGTGAGLAIVAQIAQRYGGRAWVSEREGGGCEFHLTFNHKV